VTGVDNESGDQPLPPGDTSTRDHLANERTFLAWLRTAANVMIVGLAIAKFGTGGSVTTASFTAGGILVVVGGLGVWYGLSRYNQTRRRITSRQPLPDDQAFGPALASTVLVAGVVAATIILLLADEH
jgi:putative membrane protein